MNKSVATKPKIKELIKTILDLIWSGYEVKLILTPTDDGGVNVEILTRERAEREGD